MKTRQPWTVIGGTLLGMLRMRSMSVVPAALAHTAFDLVVYGGQTNAQWWIFWPLSVLDLLGFQTLSSRTVQSWVLLHSRSERPD